MAWYMLETKYTSESMAAMVKNPQDRFAIMSEVVRKCGGKIHSFYYCFGGDCDAFAFVEVPDYLTLSSFLLAVGNTGRYIGSSKATPLLPAKENGVRMMQMAKEMAKVYQPPTA